MREPAADAPTILVVDDQEDERTIQRAMLEHHGYRVIEASSGAAALEQTRTERPALLLLDVAMPGMDGFEVCRRVKGDADMGDPAVVLFTASVVGGLSEEATAAGADDVMEKPVDPHMVARRIRELIGGP